MPVNVQVVAIVVALALALAGCATKSVTPTKAGVNADAIEVAAVVPPVAPSVNLAAATWPGVTSEPRTSPGVPSTLSTVDNTRVFPGTGIFVKPLTPSPTPASAPEETFNLNFEAQDIRSLVQSIMGDYLRETFTIHPQTASTATIRTSRPVSRKDLMPILEMLLRQNGQIMLLEEGIYKIMPATLGTRGTITPQLAGGTALPNGFSEIGRAHV